MLTVGQERSTLIEIDGGDAISAMTFVANGEYLVSGDDEKLRVWRVQDGKQMAATEAWLVRCVAVSKDGGWIAAGTFRDVVVWDAKTYGKTFALEADHHTINGVDFSPDSTRLVSASDNCTATVWDVATRQRVVGPLRHELAVRTTKFSPQGDRIATATLESVRVYDSNDGRLLVDITMGKVIPWYNNGLFWSEAYLFVVSDKKIKKIDASTGSTVSEWPVPGGNKFRPIALPTHGEFIAHSTSHIVSFWDASTPTQLGLIHHPPAILSIALSPDARFIAIGGKAGKITIQCLSRIIVSSVTCCIMVYLNNLLTSTILIFPHRIRSLCLDSTPLSRNQTFRSRMLFSICGSTINSQVPMHY
jgi:WD40 repeat protein